MLCLQPQDSAILKVTNATARQANAVMAGIGWSTIELIPDHTAAAVSADSIYGMVFSPCGVDFL